MSVCKTSTAVGVCGTLWHAGTVYQFSGCEVADVNDGYTDVTTSGMLFTQLSVVPLKLIPHGTLDKCVKFWFCISGLLQNQERRPDGQVRDLLG